MWNSPDPDFSRTVWRIVRQIPKGCVSTYGQIASMIPPYEGTNPDDHKNLSPRWVGTAMRQTPDAPIPWRRVINSQGKVSLQGSSGDNQRKRLENEGVEFDAKGKVNLREYGWEGPDDDFLDEHNLLPPNVFI